MLMRISFNLLTEMQDIIWERELGWMEVPDSLCFLLAGLLKEVLTPVC